jgi:hypothetical protein
VIKIKRFSTEVLALPTAKTSVEKTERAGVFGLE